MPTVAEILRNAGLSDYEINSLDDRTTQAFGQVLSEAESQKTSVDSFWQNVYNPGVTQWEADRQTLAKRIAAAEAKNAALERERQVLAEQGIVTGDNFGQPRNDGGQYMPTPGTPTLSDPNEFVGRAAQGLAAIADVDYKHRLLFNQDRKSVV